MINPLSCVIIRGQNAPPNRDATTCYRQNDVHRANQKMHKKLPFDDSHLPMLCTEEVGMVVDMGRAMARNGATGGCLAEQRGERRLSARRKSQYLIAAGLFMADSSKKCMKTL